MQKKIRSYLYSCAFVRVFRFFGRGKIMDFLTKCKSYQYFFQTKNIFASSGGMQYFCNDLTDNNY